MEWFELDRVWWLVEWMGKWVYLFVEKDMKLDVIK